MKQIYRIPALVVLMIMAFACKEKVSEKKSFTLAIHVLNPKQDFIVARYNERIDTFRLDSGKFIADLPAGNGTYFELQHGEQFFQVFGAVGNDLTMEFDAAKEIPVTTFSGSLQAENEYVEDRRLFDEEQLDLENNLYTAGDEDFMLVNDSLKKIREKLFLDSKTNFKSSVAAEFTYLEEALIKTKWLNRYMEHELYFPLFTEMGEYVPSAKVLEYRNQIDPNDDKLLVLDEYLGMLDYYIDIKKKEDTSVVDEVALGNLERITIQFATIDKNISNKTVNQEVKFRTVQKFLQSTGIEGAEKFIGDFVQTVSDPVKRQELTEDYKKWENIEKGQTAPEITALSMLGDTLRLSSMRGKYVYIDFWATWCKPCREEIPYLEKLMDEMKNENIAIISVSIDEDKDTWGRFVRLGKMKGIQWFANKGNMINEYNLKSIPRYVIIDPEGKMLSSNAERPSGEIRKQLKELMKPVV